MKNLYRAVSFLLIFMLAFLSSPAACALSAENYNSSTEMIGLVETNDVARTGYIPTSAWDVSEEGEYEFDGSSITSALYTLYYFTGSNYYKVIAHNRQGSAQTVNCKTVSDNKKFYSNKIPANGSLTFYVSQDSPWYLEFTGGYFSDGTDVWGYVQDAS